MMIVSAAGAVAIGLSVQASPAGLLMLLLLYALTIPADAGALTSRRGDERGSAAKGRNHGHSYDNRFRGFPHSAHGAAVLSLISAAGPLAHRHREGPELF
jgi:hypothetical protein